MAKEPKAQDPKAKDSKANDSRKKVNLSRTEERRQERGSEQRRQWIIYGLLGLLGVIVFGVVIAAFNTAPVEAPIPDLTRYEDIPVLRTERGYSRMGELDATVRVLAYVSLSNSTSRAFHADIFPALLERIKAGDISLSYILYDRVSEVSNFGGATRAGWCANEQNKFWQFVDAAYGWFDLYGGGAYSTNRLNSGAANLGLDTGRFSECMRSGLPNDMNNRAKIDADGRDAAVLPPAVFVNEVAVEPGDDLMAAVNDAIDRALALRSSGATAVPTADGTVTLEPTSDGTVTLEPTTDVTATTAPTLEPTTVPTTEPTLAPTTAPTVSPSATPGS